MTDGKSQITTWRYDENCRVTNKLDHLNSNMFVYGYDANGRLATRWTPVPQGGSTTAYRYDALGSLTNIDYPAQPSHKAKSVTVSL